jgi:acyl dehydratase
MNSYSYDEIAVGQSESFTVSLGMEQMALFCDITGDTNPLHTEHNVAYGMLTAAYLSTLAGMYLPGERSLVHGVSVEFPNPLQLSRTRNLTVSGTVTDKNDTFRLLTLKVSVTDDEGKKYLRGSMKVGVRA